MSKNLEQRDKKVLSGPWRRVQGAIWLIGLAILAWNDWWWPGILVLVALSVLAEVILQQIPGAAVSKEEISRPGVEESPVRPQEPDRPKLPEKCQECGAPVPADKVEWTSATTASCPYCGASLRMRE
jgi:hypothetical protein